MNLDEAQRKLDKIRKVVEGLRKIRMPMDKLDRVWKQYGLNFVEKELTQTQTHIEYAESPEYDDDIKAILLADLPKQMGKLVKEVEEAQRSAREKFLTDPDALPEAAKMLAQKITRPRLRYWNKGHYHRLYFGGERDDFIFLVIDAGDVHAALPHKAGPNNRLLDTADRLLEDFNRKRRAGMPDVLERSVTANTYSYDRRVV